MQIPCYLVLYMQSALPRAEVDEEGMSVTVEPCVTVGRVTALARPPPHAYHANLSPVQFLA